MQGTLFPEEPSRYDELLECFEKYDRENPEVYVLFCRFTDELIARGRTKYSARAVVHRIRWHVNVDTRHDCSKGDGSFKIANANSPFYARKWLDEHPEHEGFFKLNEQTSRRGE